MNDIEFRRGLPCPVCFSQFLLVPLFVAGPPLNISVYITVVTFGAIKEINMV